MTQLRSHPAHPPTKIRPPEPILVVAAVIRSRGRILACQRRKNDAFGLKWEFPGGKAKPGETPQQALARELKEELDVEAHVGAEMYRTRHKYAELAREIELVFFSVRASKSAMRNLAFEEMRWVEPRDLPNLDFLPADRDFIATLR
jgi:8-oxo-dGTP diphosphatase